MDANQTRFHLLLGEADWSRCTQLEPPPFRTQWDPTRYEVTLEEKLFRFLPSKFSPPLRIEQRRGAGQDRFGNWYWISDSEQEILVHSMGSAGNFEELGLLYLDDGNFSRARACYDKAISARTDSPDPFYRRGVAEVELEDFAAAVPDLERAVAADPKYDFYRAPALLAHAYANTGQPVKAEILFQQATKISTMSETYYNYALLLQAQGRIAEARQWTQKILDKRRGMPGYLRRRERPWFRKAYALLARLSVQSR